MQVRTVGHWTGAGMHAHAPEGGALRCLLLVVLVVVASNNAHHPTQLLFLAFHC